MADDFPYTYEFPLPEVEGAPVPSQADYSPRNVAPLIESFATILGEDKTSLRFRYENNTPGNKDDDIIVSHPNDGDYLDQAIERGQVPNSQMERYVEMAKASERLRVYMEASPANITYFK